MTKRSWVRIPSGSNHFQLCLISLRYGFQVVRQTTLKVYEIMQRMVDADLDKALLSTAAELKTLEGREMLVSLISPPVTD